MRGKHSKKKMKMLILNIILVLFIIILIYSCYQMIYWVKSNKESEKLQEEIASEVITIVKENEENSVDEEKVIIDFEKLEKINSDIIGWITIDNTNINYPIVQTNDNDYYLKRDINKKKNSCGSIFLDCNTNFDFTADNVVIYGHDLKSGGMFADLHKIYHGNLGNDVKVKIYLKDSTQYTYEVIAAHVENPTLELIRRDLPGNEKNKYIEKAIKNSSVKFNTTYNGESNILTLITCYGKKRVLINAVLV